MGDRNFAIRRQRDFCCDLEARHFVAVGDFRKITARNPDELCEGSDSVTVVTQILLKGAHMGHIANSDIYSNIKCRKKPLPGVATSDYTGNMKLRIKEIRTAKKLTQRQVAAKAGISLSYYTELEGGKKPINALRMEAVARALDVQPHELILREGNSLHDRLLESTGKLEDDQLQIIVQMAESLAKASDTQE